MVNTANVNFYMYVYHYYAYHNSSQIPTLELGDSILKALEQISIDSLCDQLVEINGPAKQLDMPLTHQSLISIGPGIREYCVMVGGLLPEPLVQLDGGGQLLVVREDLLTQLEYKLIETEIYFRFHFIVQELLPEHCQRVVGRVVVQVQRV